MGEVNLREDDVAVCALVSLLEEPIDGGKMFHIIRNLEGGAEMRSRFWLGFVSERDGNEQVSSFKSFVAITYIARLLVQKNIAWSL